MGFMTYDEKLEKVAQRYADLCIWEHNPDRGDWYKQAPPAAYRGAGSALCMLCIRSGW